MNQRSAQASMFWFVLGGMAGASLSLLLAPQSGKTTRRMVAGKLRGGVDSAREIRDGMVGRGEEAWDQAAQRVEEVGAAVSGFVERKTGKRSEASPVERS